MTAPEQRCDHESALIDDNLHLFGGRNGRKYFPRNEIWTYNVREEKKWIRQFAEGKNVPPPCKGARCVAINGIMYSYGGEKEDEHCLGEVFALDPKKPKWIQVATPSHKDEPWQRAYCCLWAIGARMIMFAGCSGQEMIPQNRLQPGASCDYYVNNEIYEFEIEEGGEKGLWCDVELSGKRPDPRRSAAVETIDQHRGLLHGGDGGMKIFDDAFVIDLKDKKWVPIDLSPKPSALYDHRICKLMIKEFEEKECFLLIGGFDVNVLDRSYIIDLDKQASRKIELSSIVAPVWWHTLHCVSNEDGSAQILLCGGWGSEGCQKIMTQFTLGLCNASNVTIESQLARPQPFLPEKIFRVYRRRARGMQQGGERMRFEVPEVRYYRERCLRLENKILEQSTQIAHLTTHCQDLQKVTEHQRSELSSFFKKEERQRSQFASERATFEREKREAAEAIEAQRQEMSELAVLCENIQKEMEHLRRQLVAAESVALEEKQGHKELTEAQSDVSELGVVSESAQMDSFRSEILGVTRSYVIKERVSCAVGKIGGRVHLESTGLIVTFPEDAVSKETNISVASYLPEDHTASPAVACITKILPHGLKLGRKSVIELRHHLCLENPFRIRVFYHSGFSTDERYQLLADLNQETLCVVDGETEVVVKRNYIRILCLGFSEYCTIQEGLFYIALRIYGPLAFREGELEGSVVASISCQCSEVTKKIDQDQRALAGEPRECKELHADCIDIDTTKKVELSVGLPIPKGNDDINSSALCSVRGASRYNIYAKALKSLIGEGHMKYITRPFKLELPRDSSKRVIVDITYTNFDKTDSPVDSLTLGVVIRPVQKRESLSNGSFRTSDEIIQRKLRDRVSDEAINSLVSQMAGEWQGFACALDPELLTRSKIHVIEERYPHQLENQAREMFDAWMKFHGVKATVGSLCKALIEAKLREVAENVFGVDLVATL